MFPLVDCITPHLRAKVTILLIHVMIIVGPHEVFNLSNRERDSGMHGFKKREEHNLHEKQPERLV